MQRHRRMIRDGGALIGLALVLMWAPKVHAFGCQASGALPIFPSAGTTCPTALNLGDTVDILISLTNTSSSVPPGTSVSAILVNNCVAGVNSGAPCTVNTECPGSTCGAAVAYTLACSSTSCALELPGTLTFVPVGGNGCVSNDPAVTSCTVDFADPLNKVNITVNASGVVLPAATNVPIATIRAMATAAIPTSIGNPCGLFGTRADTLANSIVTTDAQCSAPSTGGAQGSTNLFLPSQPTPTPTPTPPPLDHFQCYEIHRPPFNRAGVSLADQFGPSTVTIKRAKRICAPADKNGEDPTADTDPQHLTSYTIKQTSSFTPVKGVTVTDQFGSLIVKVGKADRLLVPTAKSLTAIPPPLDEPTDHFKCYKVSGARFRRAGIVVETQFGQLTVDIKKPLHLCTPASKNGEDPTAPNHVAHLMCYQVRGPRPSTQPTIFTTNQLVSESYTFFGPRELCVPATKTL